MKNNYTRSQTSVINSLQTIRKGDHVTVIWCDASESGGVPTHGPINNHSVESVCSAVGIFLCVQKGRTYMDPHILIVKDYLDSEKMRVQSIPLCLIKSIQSFSEKKKLLMIHKRKQVLHFKDGSVKYIGGILP